MNAPRGAPKRTDLKVYVGLALLVAAVGFATLAQRPLFNPDEGRYAEIPREMLAGGDWVIPHLNGVAYIEKPPLQYWATAAALRAFGPGEFGARFYTACCALAALLSVGVAATRLGGADGAVRAVSVLASMLLFVVLGRLLTLDMSLTFYMTLSLCGFLMAQPRTAEERTDGDRADTSGDTAREGAWMLAAWAATALGVMTKGLVAAAIPAAVLILYSLYARDWSPWRRLHAALGLPLFLMLTVPWHWLAARRDPAFLQFFFVHEHLSRYLTPSADREEAWWFFLAVFVLGSIPWTVSAVRAMAWGWRRRTGPGRFDAPLFLWIWAAFIGVFFSLSDSKLIPYLLPAMPAVALLVALSPGHLLRREVGWTAAGTVAVALALGAVGWLGPGRLPPSERNHYFLLLASPLLQIAGLLLVCGVWGVLQRRDPTRGAVVLGVGWCLAGMWLMRAASCVAPIYSGVVLVRELPVPDIDVPIYSIGIYDQTLPFYWRRPVTLVRYRGELDYGLKQKPGGEIPDLAAFVTEWQGVQSAYAVMEKTMFDDLKTQNVPMREVARDVHRVLVARR